MKDERAIRMINWLKHFSVPLNILGLVSGVGVLYLFGYAEKELNTPVLFLLSMAGYAFFTSFANLTITLIKRVKNT
jgi:hypothetical protein